MMRRFHQIWPLVRRYPFCGFCVAVGIVFAIITPLLWLRLNSLTAIQRNKQAEADAVQATLISAPQLRQELAFARQTVQRIAENLVSEESLVANQNYFLDMAEACGAQLEPVRSYNTPPPETGADYKRVPFGLRASGTFSQLAAFVHAVETGPRLANINAFRFVKIPGSPLVTLDLTVDLLGKR